MTTAQKQTLKETQTIQNESSSSEKEELTWEQEFSRLSIDYKNICDRYNKLFALYAELLDKYLK